MFHLEADTLVTMQVCHYRHCRMRRGGLLSYDLMSKDDAVAPDAVAADVALTLGDDAFCVIRSSTSDA